VRAGELVRTRLRPSRVIASRYSCSARSPSASNARERHPPQAPSVPLAEVILVIQSVTSAAVWVIPLRAQPR
jgi:hypothetical protein